MKQQRTFVVQTGCGLLVGLRAWLHAEFD